MLRPGRGAMEYHRGGGGPFPGQQQPTLPLQKQQPYRPGGDTMERQDPRLRRNTLGGTLGGNTLSGPQGGPSRPVDNRRGDPRRQPHGNRPPPQQHMQQGGPPLQPGPGPAFQPPQNFRADPRAAPPHVPDSRREGPVPQANQGMRPPTQQQAYYPPPPPVAASMNPNARGPLPSHHMQSEGFRGSQDPRIQPRMPHPPQQQSLPPHPPQQSQYLPPPSAPPTATDPRLTGHKRPFPDGPHVAPSVSEQWRGTPPLPFMPPPPSEQAPMDRRRDGSVGPVSSHGEGGRSSNDPRFGARQAGREGGSGRVPSPSKRGRRGRGGGRDDSRRNQGRGAGGGGRGGRGGRNGPIREGRGPHFADLVKTVVEALGPIMHARERYPKGQEDEVLSRFFSDVCRLRPEWQEDIRQDQLVGIARELFARRGPAWDVFQQSTVPAGPSPVPMAESRPPVSDNEKVEVMVPLVRAAYGDVFWRIASNDGTLPPYVRSPLDYTQAPPDFPLLRGLSPPVRERMLHEGLPAFVPRDGPVRLLPGGEVEVSLELLTLLYSLFFLSQSSVTCPNAVLRDVVNAVHRLVKETGRELMARDSRGFVSAILRASPLDVVSYCRKNILKRMEAIVQEVEGGNPMAVDVPDLGQGLAILATPHYNLFDPRKAAELQQLRQRVTAMLTAPPPAASAPLPFTSSVYDPPELDPLSFSPPPPQGPPSPEVSPPPSPSSLRRLRDPRRNPVRSATAKLAMQQLVEEESKEKRLRFGEDPPDKCDPERRTYIKSHLYEHCDPCTTPEGCSNPKCGRRHEVFCAKCGRCEPCSRLIFCKGGRKTNTGQAITRLHDRMDHAIWLAFRERDFDPLLALIKHANVSVNFKRTSKGETALMAAAYTGNMDVVKDLLDRGADPLMKTDDGMTPYVFASKYGHNAIAELIQEYINGVRKPSQVAAPAPSVPSIPEPMLISPTPSTGGLDDDKPLAEGLVLLSNHGDSDYPHGGHYEDGPTYTLEPTDLGDKRPQKRTRTH